MEQVRKGAFMPKVGRKTEEQKRVDRLCAFIKAECAERPDVKNLTGLAAVMGMSYSTLYYRLSTGTISALQMNCIIHALHLDADAVARLYRI